MPRDSAEVTRELEHVETHIRSLESELQSSLVAVPQQPPAGSAARSTGAATVTLTVVPSTTCVNALLSARAPPSSSKKQRPTLMLSPRVSKPSREACIRHGLTAR